MLFLAFMFTFSCTKDKIEINPADCIETIRYSAEIKELIDVTCAISGCHVSGNNVPGNFTSYVGIEGFLTENLFEKRVLSLRDMPPNYSSGPKFLTLEQLDLMACWVEQGYLEN